MKAAEQQALSRTAFAEIAEGQERSFIREVTAADLDAFASVSGDHSTLHMSGEFARSRGFVDRVAHGAFLGSLVSRLVGMALPGENALLQSLHLSFHRPVYPGYVLEVVGRVQRKLEPLGAIQIAVEIREKGDVAEKPLAVGKAVVGFTAGKVGEG